MVREHEQELSRAAADSLCECVAWARDYRQLIFWEHHRDCPKHNPDSDMLCMLNELLDGIDEWAADEDGVHYKCWAAYCRAQIMRGNHNYLGREDEEDER